MTTMTAAFHAAETVLEEEASGLPQALTMGIGTFLAFALLLFIVTRLNQDR
jgi:hypothetical protein